MTQDNEKSRISYLKSHSAKGQLWLACQDCGQVAAMKKEKKGNFFIELILFCFGILPGIVYGIWRVMGNKYKCPTCKETHTIPINSPKGKLLVTSFRPI